ncbi:crotonase/enoyl-CoA hydratase family protein [Blastomonas sp.]|uniref:crotonase/enoyl-CoA hydratase family protein n=1 Tax=Blastomonas sp. TaxID=1909299 RepID=UPI00263182EF|nr:crotonase/enoyl-CoA hydratase family protein [Blastomonas sp.]MDM7956645.1 crotonase/enoyl-CoA hydratase family protein [Blastomonas sp.]
MTDELGVDVRDGVMVITMNRPDARNAMNKEMAEGIAQALETLDADPEVRVAILTGAGGHFCSGMDLKGFLRGEHPVDAKRGFGGLVLQPPVKPLIAAVDGYALAGGLEMVLACDLVVASAGAKFGIPETKRGLVAGAGGLMRLPDQIPVRIAMELALTGNLFDAERALGMGLINRISSGPSLEAAMELALEIVANGPIAVRVSKQIITQSRAWSLDTRWEKQNEYLPEVLHSADAREGALAFAEKRKPNWRGE